RVECFANLEELVGCHFICDAFLEQVLYNLHSSFSQAVGFRVPRAGSDVVESPLVLETRELA
ncbi:MAG: hypothetical protein PV344_07080, partial [Anaplasma sp.]|nr:hypothetical protein [Anaplasma sp.]